MDSREVWNTEDVIIFLDSPASVTFIINYWNTVHHIINKPWVFGINNFNKNSASQAKDKSNIAFTQDFCKKKSSA